MSGPVIVLILLAILFFLLAMGLEIGMSIMVIALIGFVLIGQPLIQTANSAFTLWNSFVMVSIPLFVFMGGVFVSCGITRHLFDGIDVWLGRMPGGLGLSVIAGCAIFAAMSGSSLATCSALGSISLPEMEKCKYDPKMAMGAVAAGGTLGILIPPSINMVLFGAWTGTSVVHLFAGGVVPGMILALLFILLIVVRVMLNPNLAPKSPRVTWRKRIRATVGIIPWVASIVLVMYVIFSGAMTPTEASALGCLISIVLAILYRRFSLKVLREAALMSVRVSSMIALVAGAGIALVYVLAYLGIPELMVKAMTFLPVGKYGIISLIVLMYFLLGFFFDPVSMMLLTLPFVTPIIEALGYSMVWFGVFLIVLSEVAFLTPPVSMNLYIVQSILPQYTILTVFKGAIPYLLMMGVLIVLLIVWPEIALWLPAMLK